MYFEEYGSRQNKTIILLHCAAIVEMYEKILDISNTFSRTKETRKENCVHNILEKNQQTDLDELLYGQIYNR